MSFVLPHHPIESISSSAVQRVILRVSQHLDIEDSQAFLLLLQYKWNEKQVVADFSILRRIAPLLRRSCINFTETSKDHCLICKRNVMCQILMCGHSVCLNCLEDHIGSLIRVDNVLLLCPKRGCNNYLNPQITCKLPDQIRSQYTFAILKNFIANTNPDQLKEGLDLLRENKDHLFTTGAIAFTAHKTHEWLQTNHHIWGCINMIFKHVKRGGDLRDWKLLCRLFLKFKFGVDSGSD